MIRGSTRVENPETVELTISVTAKVSEWRDVVEQLGRNYPSWALASIITRTISATVTRVEAAHTEEP